MMRLVFLFSAEERGLLLLGDPLYDEHYAVSTLVARLQEAADQHGEEVLERRHDAWVRLLSTFRAVYGGVTARAAQAAALRRQAVRPRPVPVPRRPPAGLDVAGSAPATAPSAADRQPDGAAPAPVAPVPRNARRGPPPELPGARHRADRPRLRGPARPHRQAGDRADAQPDRRQGGRAGGRPLGIGAAQGQGRGRTAQVPQGGDGPVRECPQESAGCTRSVGTQPGSSGRPAATTKPCSTGCGRSRGWSATTHSTGRW